MQTLSEHITNLQHRMNMDIFISKDDIDKKSILFIENLTILVAQVRKSIILLREQKKYHNLFDCFTNGCCEYSSLILKKILTSYKINSCIMYGELKQSGAPHCWLEVEDRYDVDITIDQFQEFDIPVLVYIKAENKTFHQRYFKNIKKNGYQALVWDEFGKEDDVEDFVNFMKEIVSKHERK